MTWRGDFAVGGWFQRMLARLDPQQCLACGKLLPGQGPGVALHLCETCVPAFGVPRCCTCGRPFDREVVACGPCLLRPPPWRRLFVLGDYDGALVPLVHRFKFSGWFFLGEELGRRLAQRLGSGLDVDAIVPVPMPMLRRLRRGLDHTEILAAALSKAIGCPLRRLMTRSWSRQQVGLGARERHRARGVSVVTRRPLPGRVLLIDDVLTTGATLRACTKSLYAAGVEVVYAAVVARTPAPSEVRHQNLGTPLA